MKKICQSCAMPFSRDPKNGGTNSDDSKSEKYCSYCYQKGEFTHKEEDVKKYQKYVIDKMKENGFNGVLA